MKTLLARLKALAAEYQEIVFWMPPALLLVFGTFHLFPIIDPRSGIDGFGQLHAVLVNVVSGIVICFSAWLTKRNYLGMVSREDQQQWNAFLGSSSLTPADRNALLLARAVDLGEWVLCFGFWYIVVF